MEHRKRDHDQARTFVDTDVFVALTVKTDANHQRAVSFLHLLLEKNVMFFTSNYVFSESITVISMRSDHQTAVKYIEDMKSLESPFHIERADEALEQEAIDLFKVQTSKNTSFVDCTNMVFMQRLSADAIFSFDRVYKTNGFCLLEDLLVRSTPQEHANTLEATSLEDAA